MAVEMPSSSALQAVLDEGSGLEVELPELDVLRQRLEQARWVEAVQQASKEPTSLSLERMRKLIDQGVGLEPHACVEKTMANLQELLTVCEHCEEKAQSILMARLGSIYTCLILFVMAKNVGPGEWTSRSPQTVINSKQQ